MKLKILYFLILTVEIYAASTENRTMVLILKPLLMPILMLVAFQSGIKDRLLYLALFFSFLGDVFLLFEDQFVPGLASFLTAHVFYILLFRKSAKLTLMNAFLFLIPTLAYLLFLFPHIDPALKIPVILYCGVISTMGIMAASIKTKSKTAYQNLVLGAILFIISDSLIAFDKFYQAIQYPALWIMSTYGIAQYLIVTGWTKGSVSKA